MTFIFLNSCQLSQFTFFVRLDFFLVSAKHFIRPFGWEAVVANIIGFLVNIIQN